ncbi:MAG: hypothetical protein V4560_18630 [Bacteroidota bacterium]
MKKYYTLLILFVLCFVVSCHSDESKQVIDTISYKSNPVVDTATVLKDEDFEKMASIRGDIYNNRALLIKKIKELDPTADFSGNYSEGSDKADDEFEAPDKYDSDFQIVGSKKHIKEFNYTYRPNPNHINAKEFEYDIMVKMGRVFGKAVGEDFIELYLAAIKYQPNQAFKQNSNIGDLKFEITYETENNTINFVVTHK